MYDCLVLARIGEVRAGFNGTILFSIGSRSSTRIADPSPGARKADGGTRSLVRFSRYPMREARRRISAALLETPARGWSRSPADGASSALLSRQRVFLSHATPDRR